jgi:hypothetical protein
MDSNYFSKIDGEKKKAFEVYDNLVREEWLATFTRSQPKNNPRAKHTVLKL